MFLLLTVQLTLPPASRIVLHSLLFFWTANIRILNLDDQSQEEASDNGRGSSNCNEGNSGVGGGTTGGTMPISCGIGMSGRIVGGSIAAPGKWPWQVGSIV